MIKHFDRSEPLHSCSCGARKRKIEKTGRTVKDQGDTIYEEKVTCVGCGKVYYCESFYL